MFLNSDWLKFEPTSLWNDCLLFKQHKLKLQNSDRRSCAKGKISVRNLGSGNARRAGPPVTLNQDSANLVF